MSAFDKCYMCAPCYYIACSALALTIAMSQCLICFMVLESGRGTVRVCRCSRGEIHGSCWIALQLSQIGPGISNSWSCPHCRQKIGRSCLSACAEKGIFWLRRNERRSNAAVQNTATYVGCGSDVHSGSRRARGCGASVPSRRFRSGGRRSSARGSCACRR